MIVIILPDTGILFAYGIFRSIYSGGGGPLPLLSVTGKLETDRQEPDPGLNGAFGPGIRVQPNPGFSGRRVVRVQQLRQLCLRIHTRAASPNPEARPTRVPVRAG